MNRIRTFVLAVMATALMGAAAFAQVNTPPVTAPDDATTTPATAPATPAATTAPAATTTTPPAATAATPAQTTTTAPRNDGFDWGWIGLLGLLGLAGLTRRDARPVDRGAAYPAARTETTTTPKGGAR